MVGNNSEKSKLRRFYEEVWEYKVCNENTTYDELVHFVHMYRAESVGHGAESTGQRA